jgi:hypothetical protein
MIDAVVNDRRFVLRDEMQSLSLGLRRRPGLPDVRPEGKVAAATPAPPDPPPLRERERQEIKGVLKSFVAATECGNFDGMARLWTDDFRRNNVQTKQQFLDAYKDEWERELPRETGGKRDRLRVELRVSDIRATHDGAAVTAEIQWYIQSRPFVPRRTWHVSLQRTDDGWRISRSKQTFAN